MLAALAGSSLAVVQLVHLNLPGGVVALNSSTWDLSWLGVVYKGAYGLGTISPISDKPGEVQGMTLTLNGGDPLRIALALDATDGIQGAVVTIRTALIETATYTVLDAPVDWSGKCDTASISEDGNTASVTLTVESGAVDLIGGTPATYSDADQQALYPGDLAFQYVISQVDQPIVWPAREFFFK